MKKKILFYLILGFVLLGVVTGCKNETIVYTVTFDSNGGCSVISQKVNEGESAVKPNDPSKEGYLFVQWLLDGKKYDFSSKVEKDLTLTAEWLKQEEEKEYVTVKFNTDGGSTIANQVIEKGNKVEKPANPTKAGFNFIGWQLNNATYNFETVVTENIELVAKWEKIKEANNTNNSNSSNNTGNNAGNTSTNNGNSASSKFSTPVLSEIQMGNIGTDGTQNTYVGIDKVQDGSLEIWYATSQNENYSLLRTASKADSGTLHYSVSIPVGNCYYFKVRFVSNGSYSNYSNVVSIDNSYSTPVLSEIQMGNIGSDGAKNTYVGIDKEQIGSLEIWYATSQNGNYSLLRTAAKPDDGNLRYSVSVPMGSCYYFKVRFVSATGAYSSYSNVVGIDNSYETPVLSEIQMGNIGSDGTKNTYVGIDKEQIGSLEIWYATSQNGNYSLLRTATKADSGTLHYSVSIPANTSYYFKVRFVSTAGKYSNYSNVVKIDNLTS